MLQACHEALEFFGYYASVICLYTDKNIFCAFSDVNHRESLYDINRPFYPTTISQIV